ncbi:MAG: DUF222 domain-containing protein [Ilumatobacteraceae bacterium]
MAVVETPAQALRSVLRGDVDVLDASEVAVELGQLKAARGVIDSYEVKLTNRLRVLNASGASLPPSDVHARSGGVSAKEAAAKERRAKALDDAPAVGSKLDDGTITSDHVDALANATSRLDDETRSAFFDHDDDLAADAAHMTPEEFARSCRDLIREVERDQGIERDRQQRRQTRLSKKIEADGMYSLHGRFHPELGHAIFTALDAEAAKLVKAGATARSTGRRSPPKRSATSCRAATRRPAHATPNSDYSSTPARSSPGRTPTACANTPTARRHRSPTCGGSCATG